MRTVTTEKACCGVCGREVSVVVEDNERSLAVHRNPRSHRECKGTGDLVNGRDFATPATPSDTETPLAS